MTLLYKIEKSKETRRIRRDLSFLSHFLFSYSYLLFHSFTEWRSACTPQTLVSFFPSFLLSLSLHPSLFIVLYIARYTVTTEVSTPLKYAHVGKLTNWLFHTKGHAPFDIPSLSRGSME